MKNDKRIYYKIVDILEKAPRTRRELIDAYIDTLGLTREQRLDKSTNGRANIERSLAGAALNDMRDKGMILKSADGIYSAADQKPVIVRKERCESGTGIKPEGGSFSVRIKSSRTSES